MLLKQAKTVNWKKWAAKHECEELKEGVWLEPIQALLKRKATEAWTDQDRNVPRKLVVATGWVQNRCSALVGLTKSEFGSQRGWENESKGPRLQRKVGSGSEESRHIFWAKGHWKNTHLAVRIWKIEKHKGWSMSVEGFRNHVAILKRVELTAFCVPSGELSVLPRSMSTTKESLMVCGEEN